MCNQIYMSQFVVCSSITIGRYYFCCERFLSLLHRDPDNQLNRYRLRFDFMDTLYLLLAHRQLLASQRYAI